MAVLNESCVYLNGLPESEVKDQGVAGWTEKSFKTISSSIKGHTTLQS